MKRATPLLLFALASPALADGAFDILLFLVTGGPIAPIALGLWGCHLATSVAPGWARNSASGLAFFGALVGYWLGLELAEYRMEHITYAGAVGFYAPIALLFQEPLLSCRF